MQLVARLIGLVLCCAVAAPPFGHAQTADEGSIKAVFLFRFGAFVEWPETAFSSPGAPFVICVDGSKTLSVSVAQAAAGQTINGRPVVVRADAEDPAGCHIFYAGGSAPESNGDALRRARNFPVLTVTDENNGPQRGAIHFVLADNRVRFHIDRADTDYKGLRLSSRLLAIALSTNRPGAGGQQ